MQFTPSRGRPDGFLRLVETSIKQAVVTIRSNTIIVISDWDDVGASISHSLGTASCLNMFSFKSTNRSPYQKVGNVIANNALDSGADIIIMGNDDMAYRTQN